MSRYDKGYFKIIPFYFGYSFSITIDLSIRKYYTEIDLSAFGIGLYIRIGKVL